MKDTVKYKIQRALIETYGTVEADDLLREIETGSEVETLAKELLLARVAGGLRLSDIDQGTMDYIFFASTLFINSRDKLRTKQND